MLKRSEAGARFETREIQAVNEELSRKYDAPIDVAGKRKGFEFVAHCLGRGDLALAQIGALMLRLPDPPPAPSGGVEGRKGERFDLFATLDAAGLLKADWDEDEHPRAGVPPNRAWFAPKPKNELTPKAPPEPSAPKAPGWRGWLQGAFTWLDRTGRFGSLLRRLAVISFLAALDDYIKSFFTDSASQPSTGDIDADEIGAAKDPPKTLEELQKPPTHYQLGYDQHHIVEQNPDNIAKRLELWTSLLRKFGRAMIDDESNKVWVPRRNHWKVTAIYNRKEKGDPLGRLHRKVVNQLDFAAQREAGLEALQEAGILKK